MLRRSDLPIRAAKSPPRTHGAHRLRRRFPLLQAALPRPPQTAAASARWPSRPSADMIILGVIAAIDALSSAGASARLARSIPRFPLRDGGLLGLAVSYLGAHALLVLAFPNQHNMPVTASPSPASVFSPSPSSSMPLGGRGADRRAHTPLICSPRWVPGSAQPSCSDHSLSSKPRYLSSCSLPRASLRRASTRRENVRHETGCDQPLHRARQSASGSLKNTEVEPLYQNIVVASRIPGDVSGLPPARWSSNRGWRPDTHFSHLRTRDDSPHSSVDHVGCATCLRVHRLFSSDWNDPGLARLRRIAQVDPSNRLTIASSRNAWSHA